MMCISSDLWKQCSSILCISFAVICIVLEIIRRYVIYFSFFSSINPIVTESR